MGSTRYVALLRGINVGGRNRIAMADLRDAFTELGFSGVSTYIQSGNVLFESERPARSLESEVEAALERRYGIPIVVVVCSHRQLATRVDRAPPGFGTEPDRFYSDVVFLRAPLTPAKAMRVVQLRDGVDAAWRGPGVIYFARLAERRTQSKMSRIVGTPEYKSMTIRSWTTTTKLLDLLDAAVSRGERPR